MQPSPPPMCCVGKPHEIDCMILSGRLRSVADLAHPCRLLRIRVEILILAALCHVRTHAKPLNKGDATSNSAIARGLEQYQSWPGAAAERRLATVLRALAAGNPPDNSHPTEAADDLRLSLRSRCRARVGTVKGLPVERFRDGPRIAQRRYREDGPGLGIGNICRRVRGIYPWSGGPCRGRQIALGPNSAL